MDVDRDRLDEALAALVRQRLDEAGPHPAPDVLLAYQAGELAAEEREKVSEHLAHCHECVRTVLDFAHFPHLGAPAGESPPGEARVRAALARLLSGRPRRESRGIGLGRPRLAWAVAAFFFASSVVLAAWSVLRPTSPVPGLHGDLVAFDLVAGGRGVTRGRGERLEVPPWAREIVFRLDVGSLPPTPRFRVAIADAAGRVRLTASGVPPSPDGTVLVELERGALAPGSYTLRLFAGGRRGGAPVASFPWTFAGR